MNIKYQISNIKYQISNIKYQISNIKYQIVYLLASILLFTHNLSAQTEEECGTEPLTESESPALVWQ
jgi:hypothetical protein